MDIYNLQLVPVSVQLNTSEILEINTTTNNYYLLTCFNKVRALCFIFWNYFTLATVTGLKFLTKTHSPIVTLSGGFSFCD